MGLEHSQLYDLLHGPPRSVFVEHVPEPVGQHFGCVLGRASLSSHSLRHILQEHPDVTLFTLLLLPAMIREGLWIADAPLAAVVIYQPPDSQVRYKSVLKVTADRCEIYVETFHRARQRQTRALLKRGIMLRKHL